MIKVISGNIPVKETINSLRNPDCGAVISYLGTVRSYLEDQKSKGLSFEVEDSAMQQSFERLEAEALQKFDIHKIAIIHRTGSFSV